MKTTFQVIAREDTKDSQQFEKYVAVNGKRKLSSSV